VLILIVIGKEMEGANESKLIASIGSDFNDHKKLDNIWTAPDLVRISDEPERDLLVYGRDLIANTSKYFGPSGIVAPIANGLNCQNCHLDAGTRPFGNNFGAVAAQYPMFRSRSGILESIEFRVNDCMIRSMNGQTIDSLSKEMRAMVAYMKWLGKDVPKGVKPIGTGLQELPFLDRPADPAKGRLVFMAKCQTCHGSSGQGQFNADSTGYLYPPLWGNQSYNTGAGLYRLSRFASYVKFNMPFGLANHQKPHLTDEEAWDVAAFVNSQPRPVRQFDGDWPDLTKKAIDHPFGPYADEFSEEQHKYGPFGPIKEFKEELAKKKVAGF
jgi:thiosulfate dehydrogenase